MMINKKFPVLSTVATLLWWIGIIMCIVGIIPGIVELFEFIKFVNTTGAEWYWSKADILRIITFMVGVLWGLFTMATAEIIGVLFAIEKNTSNRI